MKKRIEKFIRKTFPKVDEETIKKVVAILYEGYIENRKKRK